MSQDFLTKLAEILDAQLGNEEFGVNELAQEVGLSRSQLHRKLQSISGKSSSQFIREYRLNKAFEMLKADEATASEVAYRVGFNSPSYFNTSFKDYFGFTPGEAKFSSMDPKNLMDVKALTKSSGLITSKWVKLSILAILVVLASYGMLQFFNKTNTNETIPSSPEREERVVEKTVAIMPFESLSNLEENQFFTEGIRQDIMDNLSRIENMVVKSQQSVAKLKDSNLSIKELGETLGIDYLVGGSVQRYEERVKIRVHLTDIRRDVQIWSQDFDREYVDIFALTSDISRQIAYELDLILTPTDLEFFEKVPTDNIQVYNYYNKGRYYLYGSGNEDWFKLSTEYFEKSVELDSTFALGYSGLAEAYFWKNWPTPSYDAMQVVKRYAMKAIERDRDISDPHRVLGWYYMNYERDWQKANEEIKLSLKLNPNNFVAYCTYAQFLHYVLGDFELAIHQLNKASKIYPNSFYANILAADFNYQRGNYEVALEHANIAEKCDPSDLWPYWTKFLIYEGMNEKELAVKELEEGWNIYPEYRVNINPMKEAYSKNGVEGIFHWLNDIDINNPDSPFVRFNAFWIAQKFGYLNDKEATLKWLRIAYENNNADMFRIKHDSAFNFLHDTPEFLELLKELNMGDYGPNSLKL